MPISALGEKAFSQGHKPSRDEVAAAVIATNPRCQGPFPAGRAALPPLSTRIQVAALIQSWSRQAALSSLPSSNTMFMQHSSNRFQPREVSQPLEFSEHFARFGLAESWQGFLPWQTEFFQCQGDHTSGYSCRGFCSFLCFLLLWRCLSHVLPAGAAREELNGRSRKHQKSWTYQVPRSVPAGRRQHSRLKLLSLNFSCSWLHTKVISCPMWGFTRFSVHLATILS